jgi:hypothetical protein
MSSVNFSLEDGGADAKASRQQAEDGRPERMDVVGCKYLIRS